jgi:hypothetical protein
MGLVIFAVIRGMHFVLGKVWAGRSPGKPAEPFTPKKIEQLSKTVAQPVVFY